MKGLKIIRQVDVFDKKTEELINEIILEDFNLEVIKPHFELVENDPKMYHPYEITEETKHLYVRL